MFNIILSEAYFYSYIIECHKAIKCSPVRNDVFPGEERCVPRCRAHRSPPGNISYVTGALKASSFSCLTVRVLSVVFLLLP